MLIKRIIDFIGSLVGLIILSPLFILIGILIKLDSKGPVFFTQERVGKNGELFKIYKFRTMVENAENIGSGLKTSQNDTRITKIGSFLRYWSLDELPQLINVLKGDMSLIGPRPTIESQVKEYDDYQKRRLEVKPGITGWAQVNGRNELTWPERIDKDIWYIDNYSLFLDLKIFFKTIEVVLFAKGVYSGRYDEVVKEDNKELDS
ncbi:sugar transferase [Fuchsiella alkaliacetigena]|uniref:sugar transferase n=1 Tax=Fuchsiella alkaliacetigena TaxID=957042 RepID=UPI002009DCCA|nr:sugar transferase [Fuchsiella alkaliacetigena]MCK8824334.1 sugar transferase [Fuchsiella alkaliacetigena]